MDLHKALRLEAMTQKLVKMAGPQTGSTHVKKCKVDGCNGLANRVRASMCEKHYMRMRRNGTTDKTKRPSKIKHSHGYVLVAMDDHPLAEGLPSGSRLYEHRVKFYDTYGGGTHACHWCKVEIEFCNMHVDHLNAVKDDNRIDNLVASCPACNKARGTEKMKKTARERGMMIEFNGVRKHVSEWASDVGISSVSMKNRLKTGWPVEKALTEPRGKSGPKAVRQ